MSRIVRALLVTAVATGAAAVVLSVFGRRAPGPVPPAAENPSAGPDHLSEAEARMLLDELDAQL